MNESSNEGRKKVIIDYGNSTLNTRFHAPLRKSMKYIAVLMLCLFNTDIALAQTIQVLDSSLFECQYKCLQKENEDLFVLSCGKNISQLYSYYYNRYDFLLADTHGGSIAMRELGNAIDHHNDKVFQLKSSTINTEYLYYNLPVKGRVTIFSQVFLSHYQLEEDTPNIQWNLINDSIKNIIGYKCQLATATFRGRNWYAWYTSDIPVSIGPWKLSGLPGLILEAYDDKGYARFTAVSLVQHGIRPVMFLNYLDFKFEKITREEYLKTKNLIKYPSSNAKATHINHPYIELN